MLRQGFGADRMPPGRIGHAPGGERETAWLATRARRREQPPLGQERKQLERVPGPDAPEPFTAEVRAAPAPRCCRPRLRQLPAWGWAAWRRGPRLGVPGRIVVVAGQSPSPGVPPGQVTQTLRWNGWVPCCQRWRCVHQHRQAAPACRPIRRPRTTPRAVAGVDAPAPQSDADRIALPALAHGCAKSRYGASPAGRHGLPCRA